MFLMKCHSESYLGPPAGQNEVSVDILFSKLFSHIKSQRAILVIDVSLCWVVKDGMGIVYLFKLIGCLRVIRILVRVIFQCQFSLKDKKKKTTNYIKCIQISVLGHNEKHFILFVSI